MQHGMGPLGRSNIPANAFVPVRAPRLPPHLRPSTEPVEAPGATTAAERDAAAHDATANGALRNLEAGHYKGVPAVRLTLNFLDELRAREAVATAEQQTPEAGLDGAFDELQQTVADFPETSQLTASTAIQFEAVSSAFLDSAAQLPGDRPSSRSAPRSPSRTSARAEGLGAGDDATRSPRSSASSPSKTCSTTSTSPPPPAAAPPTPSSSPPTSSSPAAPPPPTTAPSAAPPSTPAPSAKRPRGCAPASAPGGAVRIPGHPRTRTVPARPLPRAPAQSQPHAPTRAQPRAPVGVWGQKPTT